MREHNRECNEVIVSPFTGLFETYNESVDCVCELLYNHTMDIHTAIRHIHTWSGRYPDVRLSDRQLFQITEHFIRHLPRSHHVPGAVWNQMLGEMAWYREYGQLTPRQRVWLMHNLREHLAEFII